MIVTVPTVKLRLRMKFRKSNTFYYYYLFKHDVRHPILMQNKDFQQ